jgi:hypothetical protein
MFVTASVPQEILTVDFTVSVEMNQKESLLWTGSAFGGRRENEKSLGR